MSSLCFLGAHEPRDAAMLGTAVQSSACRRCGRTMVRIAGAWRTMPRGPYGQYRRPAATPYARLDALAVPPASLRGSASPRFARSDQ